MQLEQKEIEYIKIAFSKLKDRGGFLLLLNYVKRLLYGRKAVPFELRNLTYHSNPNANPNRYNSFQISKRSGGLRNIHAPNLGLKILQSCLSTILQTVYHVSPHANGFVPGRSILDNAKVHTGNIYVYNVDLRDFFSSIDQARIWARLQHPPFNLSGTNNKLQIANIIASLSCHKIEVKRVNDSGEWIKVVKSVLPQGAPSSPVLTNIICQRLDFYFSAIARRFGLKYSRYADDITFSSMHNVFQNNSEFLLELDRILKAENFSFNEKKTRLQKDGYRQTVTGLVVNSKPNLTKRFVNDIRQWIFFWESFGYKRANLYFKKRYRKQKRHEGKSVPQLVDILSGKLNFMKMVKGSDDGTYNKLKARFDLVRDQKERLSVKKMPVIPAMANRHSPLATVTFLKYFKYDNDYSFKGLVHRPLDTDDFDFAKLLVKARLQFDKVFLAQGHVNLPKKMIAGTFQFFDDLEKLGVPFFKRTGEHPIEDRAVGQIIQQFKGRYRFGNERSESSILSELIINTAKKRSFQNHSNGLIYSFGDRDNSDQFHDSQIKFMPDPVKFQSKANFFTWVPNVTIALSVIFDSILQHSNISGNRKFALEEKTITVEISRRLVGDHVAVELAICDQGSLFMGSLDNILKSMRRDYLSALDGICDFSVRFSTVEQEKYLCQVIPFQEQISVISQPVSGFTYILTFYD